MAAQRLARVGSDGKGVFVGYILWGEGVPPAIHLKAEASATNGVAKGSR